MPINDEYDDEDFEEHDEERLVTVTVVAKWTGKQYEKRFKVNGMVYRYSDETFDNPITRRVYKAADYPLNTKIRIKLYGDVEKPAKEEPLPQWKTFSQHARDNKINWSEKVFNPIERAPILEEGAELVHSGGILLLRRPAEKRTPLSTPEMMYRSLVLEEERVLQDSFEVKSIRRGKIIKVALPKQTPYRATIINFNQDRWTPILFVTILNQQGNEQSVYRGYIKEENNA